MKKLTCLVAAFLLLMTGCTSNPSSTNGGTTNNDQKPATNGQLTDGTYKATASGYGGEMNVEVVVAGGKLSDITLADNHESSPVINRAFPVIKERILEAQSPIVDSVSGATFSSFAVKTAVADAAKQAGTDFGQITMTTAGAEKERADLAAVTTDLLIVGGGPSGLAAAITAKQEGVDNVIVVEKLDILSGNGKFDMNFYDLINSQAQKAAGNEITVNQFKESMKDAGDGAERLDVWANEEAVLDAWLRDFGVTLDYNNGSTNHMHNEESYAGEHIQDGMEAEVKRLGIDVRTGTKGYDLVVDETGKVTGVKVQHDNEYYDINAKAVIVATGGFSVNSELVEKYAPAYKALATSNQMGATGDFVPVFEKLGYKLENMEKVRAFPYIIKVRRDLTSGGDQFLLINDKGERFLDENAGDLKLANALLEQKAYYVYDKTAYESNYRLRKQVKLGYITEAQTWEDLAKAIQVDAATLSANIETFNAAARGEAKDAYREKEIKREMDAEGPYYAVPVESARHMTKGGVSCNEMAQVITAEDKIVDGLYASGEVTWQSGGYSQSVAFGRIAARNAAAYILGK